MVISKYCQISEKAQKSVWKFHLKIVPQNVFARKEGLSRIFS